PRSARATPLTPSLSKGERRPPRCFEGAAALWGGRSRALRPPSFPLREGEGWGGGSRAPSTLRGEPSRAGEGAARCAPTAEGQGARQPRDLPAPSSFPQREGEGWGGGPL